MAPDLAGPAPSRCPGPETARRRCRARTAAPSSQPGPARSWHKLTATTAVLARSMASRGGVSPPRQGGADGATDPGRHRHRRHVHRRGGGRRGHRRDWSRPRRRPRRPTRPRGSWPASRKVLDRARRRPAPTWSSVSHGTTVATNQLLEGKVDRLGFITTEGYEFLLEIARQSVPDGYGNSYFWVKPPRIVPADLVRTVGGRLDHTGAEIRPFDEDRRPRGGPLVPRPRHRHDRRVLPARVRQPGARAADARGARARSTPTPWSRSRPRCCASTASTSGR